jgi:hypothetical protein
MSRYYTRLSMCEGFEITGNKRMESRVTRSRRRIIDGAHHERLRLLYFRLGYVNRTHDLWSWRK